MNASDMRRILGLVRVIPAALGAVVGPVETDAHAAARRDLTAAFNDTDER